MLRVVFEGDGLETVEVLHSLPVAWNQLKVFPPSSSSNNCQKEKWSWLIELSFKSSRKLSYYFFLKPLKPTNFSAQRACAQISSITLILSLLLDLKERRICEYSAYHSFPVHSPPARSPSLYRPAADSQCQNRDWPSARKEIVILRTSHVPNTITAPPVTCSNSRLWFFLYQKREIAINIRLWLIRNPPYLSSDALLAHFLVNGNEQTGDVLDQFHLGGRDEDIDALGEDVELELQFLLHWSFLFSFRLFSIH